MQGVNADNAVALAEQLDKLLRDTKLTVPDALAALAYTLARLLHGTGQLTDEECEREALQAVIDAVVCAIEGFRTVAALDGDTYCTATLH